MWRMFQKLFGFENPKELFYSLLFVLVVFFAAIEFIDAGLL